MSGRLDYRHSGETWCVVVAPPPGWHRTRRYVLSVALHAGVEPEPGLSQAAGAQRLHA